MLAGEELHVGRKTELAVADRAIARVLASQGTVLLFSGEAGLGKTHIARVIAKAAAARGARVVWGRAWEAGGAPSYWPWTQVFRALGIADDPFRTEDAASALELPQARFAAFDRAARWLKHESEETGLIVLLDDLHAADLPTLHFLHFLARDVAHTRLLLVGTYRDVEARLAGDIGTLLAKIAREGEAHALARLSREEVAEWIARGSDAGDEGGAADAEEIHAVTEGNPLFVEELLRLRSRGDLAHATQAAGLRAILDEHLSRVSASTRELLEIASVVGRDLDASLVASIAGRRQEDVERAFREAVDLGLASSLAGGERLAFSHILLRERLHEQLLPSRRASLHAEVAEALARRGDAALAAHHFFESSAPSSRAAEAALVAARAALAVLAFEEAARLCERALAKHEADDMLTVDLEITRAEGLMRVDKLELGRTVAASAAARARKIGSAARQAEAALAYGIELTGGARDEQMVTLLRDALIALPDEPTPLRARVLARLTSALIPVFSEEGCNEVLRMGAAAIDMARKCDDETLFYALTFGGGGTGFLLPVAERLALSREAVAVAERLRRPLALLAVAGWEVAQLREQGAVPEARAAAVRYQRLLEQYPQPLNRARVPALLATIATLDGDFEAAERHAVDLLAVAPDDPHGARMWNLLKISIAHFRGDPASIAPDAAKVETASHVAGALAFIAWVHAATGRYEQARPVLERVVHLPYAFPWVLIGADAVSIAGDRDLAERLYPKVVYQAERNTFFWGARGLLVFGPMQRIAGDLARLCGRVDDARRWYEEAVAIGERMESPSIVALAARGLAALGAPVSVRGHRVGGNDAPPATGRVDLRRDGELWTVTTSTGLRFHLKDSKGLAYLSHLLARPRQEVHVVELADLGEVAQDAGPVLDRRARVEYKERLESLREALDEATRFNDHARADRLRTELDAIAGELAGAVGLGGRDRKLGSHVERVRINVQRRLKDAIQRIEEVDPALGRYLSATIKTGAFCVFSPL